MPRRVAYFGQYPLQRFFVRNLALTRSAEAPGPDAFLLPDADWPIKKSQHKNGETQSDECQHELLLRHNLVSVLDLDLPTTVQ